MVLNPRVEPWTLLSGASPGEFNHTLSSAEAEREGGLKKKNYNIETLVATADTLSMFLVKTRF